MSENQQKIIVERFYGESNPDHVRDRDTFLPLNYRIRDYASGLALPLCMTFFLRKT